MYPWRFCQTHQFLIYKQILLFPPSPHPPSPPSHPPSPPTPFSSSHSNETNNTEAGGQTYMYGQAHLFASFCQRAIHPHSGKRSTHEDTTSSRYSAHVMTAAEESTSFPCSSRQAAFGKLNLGSLDLPFYIHSLGTETHPMLLPPPLPLSPSLHPPSLPQSVPLSQDPITSCSSFPSSIPPSSLHPSFLPLYFSFPGRSYTSSLWSLAVCKYEGEVPDYNNFRFKSNCLR